MRLHVVIFLVVASFLFGSSCASEAPAPSAVSLSLELDQALANYKEAEKQLAQNKKRAQELENLRQQFAGQVVLLQNMIKKQKELAAADAKKAEEIKPVEKIKNAPGVIPNG